MRNVSEECRTENQNAHFMISKFFFENRTVYAIMWKNMEQPVRGPNPGGGEIFGTRQDRPW
jgi:hypothetical protein